jgi:hypothetical protein
VKEAIPGSNANLLLDSDVKCTTLFARLELGRGRSQAVELEAVNNVTRDRLLFDVVGVTEEKTVSIVLVAFYVRGFTIPYLV